MTLYFGNSKYNRNNKNSNDNEDQTRIITDEPTIEDAPDFIEYSQKLSKIIINSNPQFTVGIFGDWGTGKTTLMQMIKEEIKTNKEYSKKATTIWFDSWRYEKEEYSLMIPLLRTIILTLHEVIIDISTDNEKKKSLQKVQKGFVKMIKAIIMNTTLNLEAGSGFKFTKNNNEIENKISVGLTADIGKILDEYKSEGNIWFNQQKISFHKHVSDNLKEALENIKNKHRLIIFIDDLDRCTPERALEILESIKTFFDIEGIIYVIGMDPSTIDSIINTKYGNNSRIDGLHYLEKIVQLQFQIPLWSSFDLSNMIKNLVNKAGLSDSYSEEILKENNQELIKKATQLNPRDIKRFINSIVLAREFYGQDIKDIEKIIAIQAFYFHGRKWIDFLKLLIPYGQRIKFLMHFIALLEIKSKDITILKDLTKIIKDDNYKEKKEGYLYESLIETYRNDKLLNDIYNKLIEIDDNDLFAFLQIASVPLLKIDTIDSYLRIVDTTGLTIKGKDVKEIDSKKPLEYLLNGQVKEFNDYRKNKNFFIHLPYADLQKRKLAVEVNLSKSFLFKADLSGADLSGAILSMADLSRANLSRANLSGANLLSANLSRVDLSRADLSGAILFMSNLQVADLSGAILARANLRGANLSMADLRGADLSGAILSMANLSEAILWRTNLSGANLSRVDLSRADLQVADLSGAILSMANLSEANLTNADLTNSIIINNTFSEKTVVLDSNVGNAIIDNHEFLEHLCNNKSKNIPEEIKNKQELRLQLESRKLKLDQRRITELLNLSTLPSK